MASEDLLTIGEAAEVVRVPVATLRYWRYLGTGPRSFRIGRRVIYRRSEIDVWVAEQEAQSSLGATNGLTPEGFGG